MASRIAAACRQGEASTSRRRTLSPWPGRSTATTRCRPARRGARGSHMSSRAMSVPWISTTSQPSPRRLRAGDAAPVRQGHEGPRDVARRPVPVRSVVRRSRVAAARPRPPPRPWRGGAGSPACRRSGAAPGRAGRRGHGRCRRAAARAAPRPGGAGHAALLQGGDLSGEVVVGPRRELLAGDEHLAGPADHDVPLRAHGGVQDRPRHLVRRVDRRRQHRLPVEVVARPAGEGGVDGGGLDQRHRDRRVVEAQFHAQGVGEALHRVLRGRVHALVGEGEVRGDGADIDQRAAPPLHQPDRHQRAVDGAPEVRAHQALVVLLADLPEGAVDRQPRDVHPGVDAAEFGHRLGGDLLHLLPLADIGADAHRLPALPDDVGGDPVEGRAAPGRQHDPRALGGGPPRRGQPDPGRGAGHDDRLVREGFVLHGRRSRN